MTQDLGTFLGCFPTCREEKFLSRQCPRPSLECTDMLCTVGKILAQKCTFLGWNVTSNKQPAEREIFPQSQLLWMLGCWARSEILFPGIIFYCALTEMLKIPVTTHDNFLTVRNNRKKAQSPMFLDKYSMRRVKFWTYCRVTNYWGQNT
jgi:hypothetical protein